MKPIDLVTVTCDGCKKYLSAPKGQEHTVKFCFSCGKMINVPSAKGRQPFHADFQAIMKDLENVKKCLEDINNSCETKI